MPLTRSKTAPGRLPPELAVAELPCCGEVSGQQYGGDQMISNHRNVTPVVRAPAGLRGLDVGVVVEQVLRVVFPLDRGDAPQWIGDPIVCGLNRGRIADVTRHRNRRVAGGADEVARLTYLVDVAGNDAGSAPGETRGNGLADATGGSSHQRNPSGVGFRGPACCMGLPLSECGPIGA